MLDIIYDKCQGLVYLAEISFCLLSFNELAAGGLDRSNHMSTSNDSNSISTARARYALVLLTSIYVLGYADRNIINLLLDSIKLEFQVSDLTMGLITGLGFTLFQVVISIPVARWADRASRVKILAGGVLLWSLMTGLSGLAVSALMLAVARMGVGVGEACLTGPSHSLLSDHYPQDKRPRAFSIMAAGGEIGIILAFLVGGWVSLVWGWRAAFLVAGLPGVILAILMFFTVREPVRGGLDRASKAPQKLSFVDACKALVGQRSFVLSVVASMAFGLHFFALQVWSPAFLQRVHGLNVAEVGTLIAVLRTVLSVSGAIVGGHVAQRCVQKYGRAWFLLIPAFSCVISGCAMAGFLFSPTLPVAIFFLGISLFTIGMQLGPVFSAVQTITPVNCRALSSTLFVSLTQLFGLGIGSAIVGGISDLLVSNYGDGALQYALLFPAAGAITGGIVYWVGSRFMESDYSRVSQSD